jgi:hypothetical protein
VDMLLRDIVRVRVKVRVRVMVLGEVDTLLLHENVSCSMWLSIGATLVLP